MAKGKDVCRERVSYRGKKIDVRVRVRVRERGRAWQQRKKINSKITFAQFSSCGSTALDLQKITE